MEKPAEVTSAVREKLPMENSVREIALRRHRECYSLFAALVLFVSLCVFAFNSLTGWTLSINRASNLLQTLASIQLITLSIIFSLVVLGVQNAGRELPGSISRQFFNIPLFRLTSGSIVFATVLELVMYVSIRNIPLLLRDISLTLVLTLGILTLPLLLFSVVVFPSLISIQGLLEQTHAIQDDQNAVEVTIQVIQQALKRNDVRTAEQALLALQSFTESKVV